MISEAVVSGAEGMPCIEGMNHLRNQEIPPEISSPMSPARAQFVRCIGCRRPWGALHE
jgi:hypothetical protein